MNARTSLVALAALAALATTALSSTSASAFGAGHFAQGTNKGSGFGGAPNPSVTHPDPHVPGASVSQSGGGMVGRSPQSPNRTGATAGMPNQTAGTPSANGQNGQGGWKPGMSGTTQASAKAPSNGNGQSGWTPGSQGGGHGPSAPQMQMGYHQSCSYGSCGDGWHQWHHSYGYGSGSYVETAPVYTPPPVYTQAPVYQAPVYQAPVQATYTPPAYTPPPVQTTYAPAPQTYVQPTAQSYASEPCNCLTKSYMQDGSVVFADNCTKETAMAAPAGWQQGQAAPQQPH